ncbi:hypothetical protein MGYG_07232 [Nannizzia gypsea CBS 118893]|uniref:LysM domain-containing protein n=1 Tax=Arthroderma gypseum (strain ATCC MYA-4604 / CBS 118893) TaxID=535722 RepID=E4V2G0_ARTGP|nr:hypothetical protein MGYG_07232 [Nannizzia gypsea CBS 118893]EFR04225.1 hypothetical protein MGYG_07232 [Nannizzia gypsea CBS 118893]
MNCCVFILLLWVGIALGEQPVSQTTFAPKPIELGETSPAGPTKSRTAQKCHRWHTVRKGDTCPMVEGTYGISHNQFLEWNPSVPKDCSQGFWVGYSYCVGVSDHPVFATPIETNSINSTTITASKTTITSTYSIRNPVTSERLTVSPVKRYGRRKGPSPDNLHIATSGTLLGHQWNKGLGDDCSGLYVGWWVCVGIQPRTSLSLFYPVGSTISYPEPTRYTPMTTSIDTAEFTASPTQPGFVLGCQKFYQARPGDTCPKVLSQFGYITEQQFLGWNPALGKDCSGLWAGYWYCAGAFSEENLPQPPTVTTTPSPIQRNSVSNCVAWYQMTLSDTCESITIMFGAFSRGDFISWNPAVQENCSNIKVGYWYCVAVPGTPRSRTMSAPASPTATNPTQPGFPSNCRKRWLVSESETCSIILKFTGITLSDFLRWNPAVGSKSCDNLLPGYEQFRDQP